jgi:hypothetical protein
MIFAENQISNFLIRIKLKNMALTNIIALQTNHIKLEETITRSYFNTWN